LNISSERMPIFRLTYAAETIARRSVMLGRQTKFQSERLMADVYLGIMIAGVNTLIVLGAALAFVVI
jgi:hypothetical protein